MNTRNKPLVAIVGRPNVGKSTLFNRIAGQRTAVVSSISGTTRDRVATNVVWRDRPFILVDTGGIDPLAEGELSQKVRQQIDVALSDADVIVVLADVQTGVTPDDSDVASELRRSSKPKVLAVNKCDTKMREASAAEFYELGLGDPVPISGYHNIGIDDLMVQVIAAFPPEQLQEEPEAEFRMAIVGRTNVGKSVLFNMIAGQERAIVSDVPGTTRDALDTLVEVDGRSILIIDTAGLRRRGRVKPGIERYSSLRTVKAIDRADVAVLVLDASELATSQDTHVAGYVLDSHKGIVLAVNKWDLAPGLKINRRDAGTLIRGRFKFAPYAPLCFISAIRGTGIGTLMDTVATVYGEWSKGLPRYELRRTVLDAIARHPPPTAGRHAIKVYSVAQDGSGPPSFTFYVNRAEMVHFSYERYLENAIRKTYGFEGSPLKIQFKGRGRR